MNFTRYQVVGDDRPDLSRFTVTQFKDIDDTYDEYSVGWVPTHDIFSTEPPATEIGDYVVTSLRIDERTVQTALLKKFCAKEEQRVRTERQIPRLSRRMCMEIKQRIRTEMIRKTKPTTVTVDVVWNVSTGTVLFFSTTRKHGALFEDFFKESTELIVNLVLVEPQPDFLTWLWWKSETGGVDVQVDKYLALEDAAGGRVVCTGPEELPEAMTALAAGKKLVQAGMQILTLDETEFALTYTTADEFKSVKLPRTGGTEQSDRDGAMLERIYLIEQLTAAIDGYREMFLTEDRSLTDIQNWIGEHVYQ